MIRVKGFGVFIKRVFVLILGVGLTIAIYGALLPDVWYRTHVVSGVLLLWVFTAYFVLPRVHRYFSRLYVPNYFIGRTKTADGFLGDPVNLAVIASKTELTRAMERSGWVQADDRTLKTSIQIVLKVITGRSYPNAPVSDLFLFNRKQDLVFQMQVGGNPKKRHHVRFWKTPDNWFLPGGHKVNWVGAATYDDAVGFSSFTWQITHRIDADIDKERDFLIGSLVNTHMVKKQHHIPHFFPPFEARNGGGHSVVTDGSFSIVTLGEVSD